MSFISLTPLTLETTGSGVRPITDGKPVNMNAPNKQSNDVLSTSGFRSYLPDWEWLDDVGETVGNVASTFATAWAQDRAGVSGAESVTTSQGNINSSNLQGQPQQTSASFFEKNKTALMIAGGVAGLGVLFLALKK
jgi:hypothetical protein